MTPPRATVHRFDPFQWFDMVWTAAAIGTLLFLYQFGSKGAGIAMAMLPIYWIVRFRTAPRVLLAIAPLLLLPGYAILSSAWSAVPATTAYYGSLYLVTVAIGGTIGAGTDRRQALYGLFIAFGTYALASSVLGRSVDWGAGGARVTTAFAGLSGSKNAAGDSAAIGLLVAGAVLALALRERRVLLGLAALVLIPIEVKILLGAESAGAMVGCLLASMALVAMNVGRIFSAAMRTAIFIAAVTTMMVAAALEKIWFRPLFAALLKATGKDAQLTGRGFIWDRAFRMIEAHPAVGVGYAAFWRRGNIEAEGIWQYMGIYVRQPFNFNFHNTFLEILVHFGYVGLVLYMLVLVPLFLLLLVRTMRAPNDISILFCAYLSYVALRMSVESQAFTPFAYSTAMIMAGLGCALWQSQQVYRSPAAARPKPPRKGLRRRAAPMRSQPR